MTGLDAPYEPPIDPELRLTPDVGDADAMAAKVVELLGPNLTARLTSPQGRGRPPTRFA